MKHGPQKNRFALRILIITVPRVSDHALCISLRLYIGYDLSRLISLRRSRSLLPFLFLSLSRSLSLARRRRSEYFPSACLVLCFSPRSSVRIRCSAMRQADSGLSIDVT